MTSSTRRASSVPRQRSHTVPVAYGDVRVLRPAFFRSAGVGFGPSHVRHFPPIGGTHRC